MLLELFGNSQFLIFASIMALAASISIVAIPSIIHVANVRHLFDDMETERKNHTHKIPRLGGIAIFCSFTIVSLIFSSYSEVLPANFLLTSSIILFAVGLKDDLTGVNSSTKFGAQFIASAVVVLVGNVKLTSLYGVFGLYDIGPVWGAIITVTTIVLCVNAFNLIDGIDGLAGTIGVVVNSTFGILFLHMQQFEIACIAFSMVGALLGFLVFNYTPAKIFMGDTGSYLIGFISIILAIRFIELNKFNPIMLPRPVFYSAPSVAISVLIIPLFDAFRVFIIRISQRKSPFIADRNHIHHRLLRLNLNHMQATLVLMVINFLFIYLALEFRREGNVTLIIMAIIISILMNNIVTILLWLKEKKGNNPQKKP